MTQRHAASLLAGVGYGDFVETDILVEQHDVRLARTLDLRQTALCCRHPLRSGVVSRAAAGPDGQLHYRSGETLEVGAGAIATGTDAEHAEALEPGDYAELVEHESMREQIQDHRAEPHETLHGTRVLSGVRRADEGLESGVDVDIHELSWADLSRLRQGLLSIFFEFYLLLFFFSRIGTIAIERARPHYPGQRRSWSALLRSHLLAEYTLVIAMPVAHLCVLSLAVAGAPFLLSAWVPREFLGERVLALALLSLIALTALWAAYLQRRRLSSRLWSALFALVTLGAALAIFREGVLPAPGPTELVVALWLLVSGALLLGLRAYDARRPGVLRAACVGFAATGAVFVTLLYSDAATEFVRRLHVHALGLDDYARYERFRDLAFGAIGPTLSENHQIFLKGVLATGVVALAIAASTLLFVLAALFNSIVGILAGWRTPEAERGRVRRVVWTGTLSLILPGCAFIIVTFSLWEIVLWTSRRLLGDHPVVIPVLRTQLDLFFMPNMVLGLGVLLIATAYAVWLVLPAAISDLVNEKRHPAEHLGTLLDGALGRMRVSGEAVRLILLVGLPLDWLYLLTTYPPVEQVQRHLVFGIGLAMLTLLFSGKGLLEKLSLGFRAGLDVGLDVTNWLRVYPRSGNARGAICRRYVSMLRHLATWREPHSGARYDAVVIVAHSQGTVITADLLRFLHREQRLEGSAILDPELAPLHRWGAGRLPLALLSFGSPLRQLYLQRFPHQYGWVEGEDGTGPDPLALMLERWSNLYASGDYVGRHLWHADGDARRWSESPFEPPERLGGRERCVGHGGHARYWTGHHSMVAHELDRLIVEAARASSVTGACAVTVDTRVESSDA